MAMSTTTIRTTTTMFGACGAESDPLYSFKSIHDAYISCRRRKRNTINALRFEASLLDNLVDLGVSLSDGLYTPSRSVCFVAKQPKHREIFAADFRDRVVHHLIVPQIEKIFESKFIHDSYACRVGKGTHAAVHRLRSFMNRITKGGRIAAYFIQLDIKSFFMSIDRSILLSILDRHIRDSRLITLAETIINQDCTRDFIYKGDPKLLKSIPPHKSLFHISKGKGLPIGNLTSQFFGNVYLNELDQFIKHKLKAKFYLRYVDDFILLHTDRNTLLEYKESIEAFLKERLELELKPQIVLKRVSEGANFLGYIVRADYILVRNRVIGNLKAKLRQFEREMVEPDFSVRDTDSTHPPLDKGSREEGLFLHIHLREENVRQLRQTLASYLGHFKHANAYKLVRGLFEKYKYLKDIFTLDDDCRLVLLYEPSETPQCLADQYYWAMKHFGRHCVFFQIGRFCNFYGQQAERYSTVFGLKIAGSHNVPQPCLKIAPSPSASPLKIKGGRGSYDSNLNPPTTFLKGELNPKPAIRNSQSIMCGFPVRYLKKFKRQALQKGLPYVVVAERGYYPSGLKERVVTEIFKSNHSLHSH